MWSRYQIGPDMEIFCIFAWRTCRRTWCPLVVGGSRQLVNSATPLSRGLRIQTENFDILQDHDGFFTNTVNETVCRATALVRAHYRYYVDHGSLSGAFAPGDSSSKSNHGQQELGVILAVCIWRVQA